MDENTVIKRVIFTVTIRRKTEFESQNTVNRVIEVFHLSIICHFQNLTGYTVHS